MPKLPSWHKLAAEMFLSCVSGLCYSGISTSGDPNKKWWRLAYGYLKALTTIKAENIQGYAAMIGILLWLKSQKMNHSRCCTEALYFNGRDLHMDHNPAAFGRSPALGNAAGLLTLIYLTWKTYPSNSSHYRKYTAVACSPRASQAHVEVGVWTVRAGHPAERHAPNSSVHHKLHSHIIQLVMVGVPHRWNMCFSSIVWSSMKPAIAKDCGENQTTIHTDTDWYTQTTFLAIHHVYGTYKDSCINIRTLQT